MDEFGAGEPDFLSIFEGNVAWADVLAGSERGGFCENLAAEAEHKRGDGPQEAGHGTVRFWNGRPGRHGQTMVAECRGVGRTNQGGE